MTILLTVNEVAGSDDDLVLQTPIFMINISPMISMSGMSML